MTCDAPAWGNPKPYNILTKPIGPRCNIDCKYCYYLEKEKLYPEEKKFRMSENVLESYIRQHIHASAAAGMREISFAWQGGEPTMLGVDYFKKIVELQKKHLPSDMSAANSLQTNGILLDDAWGEFFKENHFLIGLSIDGPQKVHDRYRVDRAGRPTFKKVMQGLEVLQRHSVDFNSLTTVHRANGAKGKDIYKFLKDLGIQHMQFIPIAERNGLEGLAGAPQIDSSTEHSVTAWSVSPRLYGKFLCDVFDVWFRSDIGRIFVQHFDVMLGKFLGDHGGLCVFAETCGNALAVEHDGSVYSCDHYVYPEYKLGNLTNTPLEEMLWNETQTTFGMDKKTNLTQQCQKCSWKFACNGGCPKHRFSKSQEGELGHNYFCEGYTMFFRHTKKQMAEMARLVSMGRPAFEAASKKN